MLRSKKLSSLKEKATVQVAINLCQGNNFKEVALFLEKPTYGKYMHCGSTSRFVSDPEEISRGWFNGEGEGLYFDSLSLSNSGIERKSILQWDAAIDEQCQKLTGQLPHVLKHEVHAWINRIAFEYLTYCRRQEMLFGVSRYFLMDILSSGDWLGTGRLDENKLAERLLEDERLTVLQRYQIACIYCISANIPQLWKRLKQNDKKIIISNKDDTWITEKRYSLVLIWTQFFSMKAVDRNKKTARQRFWSRVVHQAVLNGNLAVLISSWKHLEESERKKMVINKAALSLEKWKNTGGRLNIYNCWIEFGTTKSSCNPSKFIEGLILPSYYSELVYFFMSEMNKEQQLCFFRKAFQKRYLDFVLECFLDWPLQDYFLLVINELWGLVPIDKYIQCLIILAGRFNQEYEKVYYPNPLYKHRHCCYDYRNLLRTLWEITPEQYKRHVFQYEISGCYGEFSIYGGKKLLPRLLEEEEDEALFKHVFQDLSQEEKTEMIRSKTGGDICWRILEKERYSLVNWLLEKCLPKDEIPNFKKYLIQLDHGCRFCASKLKENCEKSVEDVIDWSFNSDKEKMQFKYDLIYKSDYLKLCKSLLHEGQFKEVDRMINFCLLDNSKEQFKINLAKQSCRALLKFCQFIHADKILNWTFDTKDKIKDFKKDLFFSKELYTHWRQLYVTKQWYEVEYYYDWFCLSSEEMAILKKETIFNHKVIENVSNKVLNGYHNYTKYEFVRFSSWFLVNEEMVSNFKKQVEGECFKRVVGRKRLNAKEKKAKEYLDYLIKEMLCCIKEREARELEKDGLMENRGIKRSFGEIEDESS